MALASFVDPNWTPDPNVNPNALGNLAPPSPSTAEATPPSPVPAGPMSSTPPMGVDYAAPAGSQPQGAPQLAPPVMRGISADEAMKLARQGVPGRRAGFQPTTQSQSFEGRAASPELKQATADKIAADAQAARAQNAFDVAQVGAQNQAQARLDAFDVMQAHEAQARAQEQQQRLAADRQHIQDLMAASSKPDPSAADEYWGSKSTFSKIATGLSMFMKGFVFSGYGRGQDPGQWLNQQIAQVVQEQQNRAAKTREAVGNAKDLYSFNKAALGDDERAKLATELALRNQVQSVLQRRVAEATADPMAQLRAAQLQKTVADQTQQTLEQFWDKTADKHTTSTAEKYTPAVQAGGDILQVLRRAKEIKGLTADIANDVPEQTTGLELQKKSVENQKSAAEAQKAAAAAAQPGGGKGAGRALLRGMAANHANIDALEELGRLSRSAFSGPQDKARGNVLLQTLKKNGIEGLPDALTNEGWQAGSTFSRLTGALPAAIEQARQEQVNKFNRAQELIRNGGIGADLDQPIEGAEAGVAPE